MESYFTTFKAKAVGGCFDGKWVSGHLVTVLVDGKKEYFIKPEGQALYDTIRPTEICFTEGKDVVVDIRFTEGKDIFRVDESTLCRSTGIELNGYPLWENDIIETDIHWRGFIKWHKNGYFYIRETPIDNPDLAGDCDCVALGKMLDVAKFTRIGNRFDNPELLRR